MVTEHPSSGHGANWMESRRRRGGGSDDATARSKPANRFYTGALSQAHRGGAQSGFLKLDCVARPGDEEPLVLWLHLRPLYVTFAFFFSILSHFSRKFARRVCLSLNANVGRLFAQKLQQREC